jgi:hypothetical protein
MLEYYSLVVLEIELHQPTRGIILGNKISVENLYKFNFSTPIPLRGALKEELKLHFLGV